LTIFSGVARRPLDVHAAGGARHHHRLAAARSSTMLRVQLARHLQAFLDEHARDDAPFGAGLVGDERHADHRARSVRPRRRARELDAAALAAAAA
jgi:hypothetical protein